jgi:hypothetical protein
MLGRSAKNNTIQMKIKSKKILSLLLTTLVLVGITYQYSKKPTASLPAQEDNREQIETSSNDNQTSDESAKPLTADWGFAVIYKDGKRKIIDTEGNEIELLHSKDSPNDYIEFPHHRNIARAIKPNKSNQ